MSLVSDIESAAENISDDGGTVSEHATLLARDHSITFAQACQLISHAVEREEQQRDADAEDGFLA
jgi:hypothetical protein